MEDKMINKEMKHRSLSLQEKEGEVSIGIDFGGQNFAAAINGTARYLARL